MLEVRSNLLPGGKRILALTVLLTVALAAPISSYAKAKKKKLPPGKPDIVSMLDYSKLVWPQPPDVARVKFTTYYTGEKIAPVAQGKKKESWMDRVAGTKADSDQPKLRFALGEPYGLAVDSKGNLYTADTKVGAIFIFNTETKDLELIKNGSEAHFIRIIGLAMDDADRLFVADADMHRVLVFNPKHEVEATIQDGMVHPGGLALDLKNRFLYVSDVELDQVMVYDADTTRLLRKIGTTGRKHELTTPGDFSEPGGMAVDKLGNLYVCDTMNNRIEVFSPEGEFISTYGKNGDGPGFFARPKGIAIDSDGHIWVVDGAQDRLQVFDKKWQLLTYFGGHGKMPGQFSDLNGITIDSQNRVFTSEMYPGRVQQFLYIPDAVADAEKTRRQAELDKKGGVNHASPVAAPAQKAVPADKK